jgi:hypothetical protein
LPRAPLLPCVQPDRTKKSEREKGWGEKREGWRARALPLVEFAWRKEEEGDFLAYSAEFHLKFEEFKSSTMRGFEWLRGDKKSINDHPTKF